MTTEERLATAMAETWMGDQVDCADVGTLLAPEVDAIAREARRAGVGAAHDLFDRMWRSGDWEGQVSIGFASTFAEELDRCLE